MLLSEGTEGGREVEAMVSTAYDEDRLGGRGREVGTWCGWGGVYVTAWCIDNDHHHEILRQAH